MGRLALLIDQRTPNEVALGDHCCDSGVIFGACSLNTSNNGYTGEGEGQREVGGAVGDVHARNWLKSPARQGRWDPRAFTG